MAQQVSETTKVLDKMWEKLRDECCADPKTAVRISMLTPDKFKQVMKPFAERLVTLNEIERADFDAQLG
jgi:hypothetical protein